MLTDFFRTDGVFIRAEKERYPWLVRLLTTVEWKISYRYYLFVKNDLKELTIFTGSYVGEFTSILKSLSKQKPADIHRIASYQILSDKKVKYINRRNDEVVLSIWPERQLLYADFPLLKTEEELEFIFYLFPLSYVWHKSDKTDMPL